jgi:hypothetical protein
MTTLTRENYQNVTPRHQNCQNATPKFIVALISLQNHFNVKIPQIISIHNYTHLYHPTPSLWLPFLAFRQIKYLKSNSLHHLSKSAMAQTSKVTLVIARGGYTLCYLAQSSHSSEEKPPQPLHSLSAFSYSSTLKRVMNMWTRRTAFVKPIRTEAASKLATMNRLLTPDSDSHAFHQVGKEVVYL